MKVYSNGDNGERITTKVNKTSLIIDIPINILKTAFECCPNNYDESIVRPRKTRAFANLIAEHLHDEVDSEDGATHIHRMLDLVFDEIFEGNIYAEGIVKFGEDVYE